MPVYPDNILCRFSLHIIAKHPHFLYVRLHQVYRHVNMVFLFNQICFTQKCFCNTISVFLRTLRRVDFFDLAGIYGASSHPNSPAVSPSSGKLLETVAHVLVISVEPIDLQLFVNSRSPWGERPFFRPFPLSCKIFQSTLPAGGATGSSAKQTWSYYISIHAPRGGSDTGMFSRPIFPTSFQSTLPAGGATG